MEHRKPGFNPALPHRNQDCPTCGNHIGKPGEHCTEYRRKPDFDCMKHTNQSLGGSTHLLQQHFAQSDS